MHLVSSPNGSNLFDEQNGQPHEHPSLWEAEDMQGQGDCSSANATKGSHGATTSTHKDQHVSRNASTDNGSNWFHNIPTTPQGVETSCNQGNQVSSGANRGICGAMAGNTLTCRGMGNNNKHHIHGSAQEASQWAGNQNLPHHDTMHNGSNGNGGSIA